MVTPVYLVVSLLGIAFALGILGKPLRKVAGVITLATMAFASYISVSWFMGLWFGEQSAAMVFTAGFRPPFSINLLMGFEEAFFLSLVNLAGLFGTLFLYRTLMKSGVNAFVILLILIMGLNVIIMTRDLFNLFVFMEISSIATAGIIILNPHQKTISAGFKYMLATGIVAGILLLGIIFFYHFTGTLNLDDTIRVNIEAWKGITVALFFILIAVIVELKPFPANGWGLDVYESVPGGIGMLISTASASAMLYVVYKLLPIAPPVFFQILTTIGIGTFFFSNLLALKQTHPNRLLGYSSVGQIGLITGVIGLSHFLGNQFGLIAASLLISHYLAKAGLFWISGILNKTHIREWSVIRQNRLLLFLFSLFVFLLLGFPPFPAFYGKWELIMQLAGSGQFFWLGAILVASLLEGVYLFRWLGYAMKLEAPAGEPLRVGWNQYIPLGIFGLATFVTGYYATHLSSYGSLINLIPLAFALGFFLIDFLPVYIKNTLAIAGMGFYFYYLYPDLNGFDMVFSAIFLVGGILTLLAGYAYKGKRIGFYPTALMMFAGLIGLVEAKTTLEFFFAWEVMTAGSYFLIIRGKKSMEHALSYMLFSLGGAYLILAGFSLASIGQSTIVLDILATAPLYAPLIFILLAIGFMTKTASIGLHIWLPGAHAEAETDVSPMVSSILLKAGVFGLIILIIRMGEQHLGSLSILYILSWIGAITAVLGNLMAAFQEDAKRLLAYSSIGVLGYILFGLALFSHLGWLAAIAIAVTHFLFKALLFLAIGGVVWRLKTKEMYRMGGLITRMPFTFISVLIGIIVLAGIPPLSGFAGKWIFTNAVIEKEWFFQGALISFAGIIAFLYCFRLIHTIFLGQLKDEHRKVNEAPFWILAPQYIILIIVMVFSVLPNSLLHPIGEMLKPYFPDGALTWQGQYATSIFGYWNGTWVMYVVVAIFLLVFLWLWFMNRKAYRVKQFNIVFAAERPFRPETTHFAYNFFAPYKKAIGFLAEPGVTRFWGHVSEGSHAIAELIRRIYSGNGQVYLFQIMAFIVVVYLISFGGF
ncbi:MAG: hypothetical protein JXA23_07820 [Bacteroidales bacterium]|nr:hypothetical protein [Bacteroidales bacterium]